MELSECDETMDVSVGIDVSKGHSMVSFFVQETSLLRNHL